MKNNITICHGPLIVEEFKTSEQLAAEYLERKAGKRIEWWGYIFGGLFLSVALYGAFYPEISRWMR